MKRHILFISYLRVTAILLVVGNHLLVSFWARNKSISKEILVNPIKNLSFNFLSKVAINLNLDLGLVGVCLFFLISGFIISYSIEKKSWIEFLIARAIRVYPVYWFCFLISLLILYTNAYFYKVRFDLNLFRLFSNAFLIHDWLNIKPFDIGIWALLVIVKFYIIAAIVQKYKKWKSFIFLISLALVLAIVGVLANLRLPEIQSVAGLVYGIFFTIIDQSYQLVYFLFGVAIYNLYCQSWSRKKTIIFLFLIYLIFISALRLNPFAKDKYIVNAYNLGLVLFLIGYSLRNKLVFYKIINFIASISYPMYLINRIVGYSLLNLLLMMNFSIVFSVFITLFFLLIVAYLLSKLLEEPVNVWRNQLTHSFLSK